jgi:hypothetical protein
LEEAIFSPDESSLIIKEIFTSDYQGFQVSVSTLAQEILALSPMGQHRTYP